MMPQLGQRRLLHGRGVGTLPCISGRRGFVIAGATTTRARAAPSLPTIQMTQLGDIKGLDSAEMDLKLRDVRSVSYVSRRRMDDVDFDPNEVDEDGLPLVYNEDRIASYWGGRPGELTGRWTKFAAISAPWLTSLANAFLQGKLVERRAKLAREAVENLEKLGPTFIKLGQILSIRPDVLPPDVLKELSKLQDRIAPFPTDQARAVVEKELGAPLDEIFSEFSDKPIAAASLAQVYRARLRSTGEEVAVKVQRPQALATISKDLYVMRRAVGVYERLVKRFTAQTTDYQRLLSTFAEGLYTEMDFRNEALNGSRMSTLLEESEFAAADIVIPQPYMQYTTRRVLTMEWVTGVKLTTLQPQEIRGLVKVGQEAFLTQLLEIGFFHGDPHPGNLLKVTEGPHAGKLALLDFGLVAEIPAADRQAMVSATIHLANRDWDALVDDFVALGFLPRNPDRPLIIPVMDRALSQDLLAATLEIPFSVPPYMSLLARSVATLEGIALVGDPNYAMVAQAYPFVARKVLRNDSSTASALLRDLLQATGDQGQDGDNSGMQLQARRLASLLNAALGYVAEQSQGFVDFDALPAEGASVQEIASFLLSPEARDLRPLLVGWVSGGLDLLLRDRLRKGVKLLMASLTPRLPFIGSLPAPPPPPIPVPGLGLVSVTDLVEKLAPPLEPEEQVYLQQLTALAANVLGVSSSDLESPSLSSVTTLISNPSAQVRELASVLSSVTGSSGSLQVATEVAVEVADRLAAQQAQRAGVSAETLFPVWPTVRQQLLAAAAAGGTSGAGGAAGGAASAAGRRRSVRVGPSTSAGSSSSSSRGLATSAALSVGSDDEFVAAGVPSGQLEQLVEQVVSPQLVVA